MIASKDLVQPSLYPIHAQSPSREGDKKMRGLSRLSSTFVPSRFSASPIKMVENKTSPISILGSGAWGLSTALHLVNAGYANITVFDRASKVPSPYSAGFDLNKIVRPEYEDPFYTELSLVSENVNRVLPVSKIMIAKH